MSDATEAYNVTADELRQFIERAEQLEREKKDVAEQVTDRDPKTGTLSRIFILEEAATERGGYVLVTTAAHHVITLLYAAQTLIRVRGVGLTAGPWVIAALGTLIPNMWNTDPTAMWTTNSNPMWSS